MCRAWSAGERRVPRRGVQLQRVQRAHAAAGARGGVGGAGRGRAAPDLALRRQLAPGQLRAALPPPRAARRAARALPEGTHRPSLANVPLYTRR